ncbi:hypothetical protein GJ496_010229 [Pomphorhynchus laevis]|nr:hypothetical protein GJ496_010229 [Pomphorhynchus laevis]
MPHNKGGLINNSLETYNDELQCLPRINWMCSSHQQSFDREINKYGKEMIEIFEQLMKNIHQCDHFRREQFYRLFEGMKEHMRVTINQHLIKRNQLRTDQMAFDLAADLSDDSLEFCEAKLCSLANNCERSRNVDLVEICNTL